MDNVSLRRSALHYITRYICAYTTLKNRVSISNSVSSSSRSLANFLSGESAMIVPLTDTFALTVPIVLESGNRAVTHSPNLNFLTIILLFLKVGAAMKVFQALPNGTAPISF